MASSSDGSAAQCLCMSAECSICGTPAVVHCTAPSVAPVCYCMSTHCAVCGGQPASLSATSSQTAAIDGRKKGTLAADIEDDSDSEDCPLEAKTAMELAQPRSVSFSALECIGRPRGERWDFWEMHGGCCAFTTAVITRGLRAGPAVDNKPAGLTGPPCFQVDIFVICMGFRFCFECLVFKNGWSWCLLEYVCFNVSVTDVYVLWATDCAFCYAILIQYLVKRHGATWGYCQHHVATIPQTSCCININYTNNTNIWCICIYDIHANKEATHNCPQNKWKGTHTNCECQKTITARQYLTNINTT